MKKRKTRCYLAYCEAGGIFNNEVLYTADDGYRTELGTCINCGTVFVVDRENPRSANLSLHELACDLECPECGSSLRNSIRKYPDFFVGQGGRIGSFRPSPVIPSDQQSRVVELWEIQPKK